MSKVAIVTDSTAYLPADVSSGYEIHSVPLQLVWGSDLYRDGLDITPNQFYTRLPETKVAPTTSQPSPAAFKETYSTLSAQGFDILSIHISSKLSGTIDSASQAKAMMPDAAIEIVDSLTTSMSMGFQVMAAARAAAKGASLLDCKSTAEQARANSGVLFLLNTLEFLRRGGRIGSAAAFLGTALNLKPVLEVVDGKVEGIDKVRTWSKGMDRLLEIFETRIAGRTPLRVAALYGGSQADTEAEAVLERVRQRFGSSVVIETLVTPVSPVIGVHTGPGVVGLAYLAGM